MNSARQPSLSVPFAARARLITESNEADPLKDESFIRSANSTTDEAKRKDSAYKGSASFDAVVKRARAAKGADDNGWRAEFIRLVETAELLKGPFGDKDISVDSGL